MILALAEAVKNSKTAAAKINNRSLRSIGFENPFDHERGTIVYTRPLGGS